MPGASPGPRIANGMPRSIGTRLTFVSTFGQAYSIWVTDGAISGNSPIATPIDVLVWTIAVSVPSCRAPSFTSWTVWER